MPFAGEIPSKCVLNHASGVCQDHEDYYVFSVLSIADNLVIAFAIPKGFNFEILAAQAVSDFGV